MDGCQYKIKHRLGWRATCNQRCLIKKLHLLVVSPSTKAKETRKILLLPSYATTISNIPLYFPYNHVQSICIISLKNAKSLMHGSYAHKSLWNILFPLIQFLSRVNVGSVSKISIVLGA